MNYNGRLYPHPVLGIDDNYNDSYSAEMVISSDSRKIKLSITHLIDNSEIMKLVNHGCAEFCTQLYCRSTMFRQSYTHTKQHQEIEISSKLLRDEIETDFFICASKDIKNYTNSKFNHAYSNAEFEIESGDLLAYGGNTSFFADKSPEELKNISSFMSINTDNKSEEPMKIEYDGEKIMIILSQEDYETYQFIKKENYFISTLHSSIVLPSLSEIIRYINTTDGQDYKDKKWFKILSKLLEKYSADEPFISAQKILDLPVNRSFTGLFEFAK